MHLQFPKEIISQEVWPLIYHLKAIQESERFHLKKNGTQLIRNLKIYRNIGKFYIRS